MVCGVSPTTASTILAKVQDTGKEFLNDPFEAKLKCVMTRPYCLHSSMGAPL